MSYKKADGSWRPYKKSDVKSLRDSFDVKHTIAKKSSKKLWTMITCNDEPVRALGALTGNQAMQMVKAGLKSIYCSGWQVAADFNDMYPDIGVYPSSSMPDVVKKINNSLRRASQIDKLAGKNYVDLDRWLCPIVADMEAGFGSFENTFELTKKLIEAGVAGVHIEDQDNSSRRCGHLAGKTLVPTKQFIKTLTAARLASDVCKVPTVLIARTDAESAGFITSDIDPYDAPFISDERVDNGYYRLKGDPMERCIARGLAYAPYADLLWMETSKPDLEQAERFAEAIHVKYPNKPLAYNCSPSFNWKKHLSEEEMRNFQTELGKLKYKFQFITLAGFHSLNHSMFDLAQNYRDNEMFGYSQLQEKEFAAQDQGYTAVKHQQEVGTSYFDKVRQVIEGNSEMSALEGSTEDKQF